MQVPLIQGWGEAMMTSIAAALALMMAAVPKIIGFLLILLVGWFIARRWPGEWVRTAFFSLIAGVLFGQVLEPLYEAVFDEHRFGLVSSPERWLAFWQALAAGTLLYIGGLWLGQRRSSH